MLKKVAKDHALPTLNLNFNSLGEMNTFGVTYYARDQQSFNEKLAESQNNTEQGMLALVLFVVKDWETEWPLTEEGIKQAEGARPGLVTALIQGWYQARNGELEKN